MVVSISLCDFDNRGRLLLRQEIPDARDHLVPIAQQEEGNHRRQEQERHGIEEAGAALEQALRLRYQPRGDVLPELLRGSGLPGLLRPGEVLQIVPVMLRDVALGALVPCRQILDKFADLGGEGRHDQRDDRGQHNDRERDHDERRHRARDAHPMQAVNGRVKQIGEHEADREGQKDAREEHERDQHQGGHDQPEGGGGRKLEAAIVHGRHSPPAGERAPLPRLSFASASPLTTRPLSRCLAMRAPRGRFPPDQALRAAFDAPIPEQLRRANGGTSLTTEKKRGRQTGGVNPSDPLPSSCPSPHGRRDA